METPQLDSGIEVLEGGSIVCTGDGIKTYANLMLYSGLALECGTGLKMSRHGSAQSVVKRDYGFKGDKFSLFQQLGKRYVDQGFIERDTHVKHLDKFLARGKITQERHAALMGELRGLHGWCRQGS